jgi:RHS repeat-associated protein
METEELFLSPEAANHASAPRYGHGPFGEFIRATGTRAKANPFRFSTKYEDEEPDLPHYGYRYYKPSTGRWLSMDPGQEDGGRNSYCTSRNDTANLYELLGMWSTGVHHRMIDDWLQDPIRMRNLPP